MVDVNSMLESAMDNNRNTRRNSQNVNLAYLSLMMWIEEEIEYYKSVGNGIGIAIIQDLLVSMEIEKTMNPNYREKQEKDLQDSNNNIWKFEDESWES